MALLLGSAPAPLHELKPYKSLGNEELSARIEAVRRELGPRLMILGHHYQQDEVIAHSDLRGDSYQLSQMAAAQQRLPRTSSFAASTSWRRRPTSWPTGRRSWPSAAASG